jgi:ParB family chromosome partitioning protein
MKRGGLGRGLSALIPGAVEETGLLEISVDAIRPNPRQPRSSFNRESLAALARSIRDVGVLQPVVVRRGADGYELVAGERRLRAAREAGLATIPAVVRDTDAADSLREALIENIHREQLGPLELAEAYRELLEDLGTTQDSLAERLGVSRPHVANTIRLLQLPPEVQRLLAERKLQAGHARALLALEDPQAQVSLALRAAAEGLSVRDVEEIVRRYGEPVAPPVTRARPQSTVPETALAEAEEILSEQLQTRVRIQMGKRRGRILVDVGSTEDLDRIIADIVGARVSRRRKTL